MKDSMKNILPKDFEKYPKCGFEAPVDRWLRYEMKEDLKKVLSRKKIEEQGLFNYEYIKKLMQEHFTKTRNRKDELWALYVFEKWYERVMV